MKGGFDIQEDDDDPDEKIDLILNKIEDKRKKSMLKKINEIIGFK